MWEFHDNLFFANVLSASHALIQVVLHSNKKKMKNCMKTHSRKSPHLCIKLECFNNLCFVINRGKAQAARDIAGRTPITHYWDSQEIKLLVCEAKLLPSDQRPQQQNQSRAVSLTKNTMEELVSGISYLMSPPVLGSRRSPEEHIP